MTKNKLTKIISSILIIAIVVPCVFLSNPKKADAYLLPVAEVGPFGWISRIFAGTTSVSTVTNTGLHFKDIAQEVLRQIVMTVERRLLQEITRSTVNWINSGFHGSPLFLQNPDSFFRDIGKYEIKTFITMTGYDPNRFPFGEQFALDTINSYKRQFSNNAQYSLSKAIQDPIVLNNLRNNFNYGGWNAFLINTQYPQNNYIGYRMLATEELARKLDGTATNSVKKVQTTLQQGMGFLSPQTCPSNPNYNNGTNEFVKPVFQPKAKFNENYYTGTGTITTSTPNNNGVDCSDPSIENYYEKCQSLEATGTSTDTNARQAAYNAEKARYDAALDKEKAEYAKANTCPGGLVTTTPGSVVANQITTAMGSQFRQSELAAALGNSISAILDAFINHFLDKGLSSLASTINPPAITDTFSYQGNTLGSPTVDTTNTPWNGGPDQVIILKDFKKAVQDSIDNTTLELQMMDNDAENNLGITQTISAIWPKIQDLDQCLPGPDLGWPQRLTTEMNRNESKLQQKIDSEDPEKSNTALEASNDLEFAVSSLKDWMLTKMKSALPNARDYIETVNGISDLYQQSSELTDKKKLKLDAIARLKSIQIVLDTITTEPTPGSANEATLVNLQKKYEPIRVSISNTTTLEDTRTELLTARNQYYNLKKLVGECTLARKAKGFDATGGADSELGSLGGEQNYFCNAPIVGGYSHKTFTNTAGVTHPDIPLVNASNVLPPSSSTDTDAPVNISLNCNIIYNANKFDYKKDLP